MSKQLRNLFEYNIRLKDDGTQTPVQDCPLRNDYPQIWADLSEGQRKMITEFAGRYELLDLTLEDTGEQSDETHRYTIAFASYISYDLRVAVCECKANLLKGEAATRPCAFEAARRAIVDGMQE